MLVLLGLYSRFRQIQFITWPIILSYCHCFCLGNALKKAGGEAFEEEVENLAKDKSPLDVAGGKFT
jgi:hypothetical protein